MPSSLREKSSWHPPLPPRTIDVWVNSFLVQICGLIVKRQRKHNPIPHQQLLLSSIQENQSVIIAQVDKNLGPVGIDVGDYIKLGLDHLLDVSTYGMLTEAQAEGGVQVLQEEIYSWTVCHHDVVNYIRKHFGNAAADALGYFYLLIQIHKTPIAGHPVCLDCGSLPHALGQWVNKMLQPVVQDQALYFKNSAELKLEMENLTCLQMQACSRMM